MSYSKKLLTINFICIVFNFYSILYKWSVEFSYRANSLRVLKCWQPLSYTTQQIVQEIISLFLIKNKFNKTIFNLFKLLKF